MKLAPGTGCVFCFRISLLVVCVAFPCFTSVPWLDAVGQKMWILSRLPRLRIGDYLESVMKLFCAVACLVLFSHPTYGGDWKLVWSDEFDRPGLPDPSKWNFEQGFIRNH